MKEIRIHGRGGQGSLVLAQFFAMAALEDQKFSQAFPFLGGGGERRGKPIQAFVRIDNKFIRLRTRVHTPDYVIVQDPTILKEVDVLDGLKDGGLVFINTQRPLTEQEKGKNASAYQWLELPASEIAISILGRPLMNSAFLGAFSALTDEINFSSIVVAIGKRFQGNIGHQNVKIATEGYNYFRKE